MAGETLLQGLVEGGGGLGDDAQVAVIEPAVLDLTNSPPSPPSSPTTKPRC